MNGVTIFRGALLGAVLTGLTVIGCSGSTGGEGDSDAGSGFVADASTVGTIELTVNDSDLEVAGTSEFLVRVVNSRGEEVPQIRVLCDTDRGLALVEPNSGVEMTSGRGVMSGVVGCESEGSFRVGCRLALGGNLRKFATIRCSGETPVGFSGFPNAGGGGLGGGNGGDGEPDSADRVRITGVTFREGDREGTNELDSFQEQDCDPDTTGNQLEPFFDSYIRFSVTNESARAVTFSSVRFIAEGADPNGGDYESPTYSLAGRSVEVQPSSSAEIEALFAYANNLGSRCLVGTTGSVLEVGVNFVSEVSFTLYGTDSLGQVVQLSASTTVHFGSFDHCED